MSYRMLVWDLETGSIVHRATFDEASEALAQAEHYSNLGGTRSVGLYNQEDRTRHIVVKRGVARLPFTARRWKTGEISNERALAILEGATK